MHFFITIMLSQAAKANVWFASRRELKKGNASRTGPVTCITLIQKSVEALRAIPELMCHCCYHSLGLGMESLRTPISGSGDPNLPCTSDSALVKMLAQQAAILQLKQTRAWVVLLKRISRKFSYKLLLSLSSYLALIAITI